MCVYMYVINNNITTSFFFHGTCVDTINSGLFFLFNVLFKIENYTHNSDIFIWFALKITLKFSFITALLAQDNLCISILSRHTDLCNWTTWGVFQIPVLKANPYTRTVFPHIAATEKPARETHLADCAVGSFSETKWR